MPEGHTIHRLALEHARWLVGDRLRVSSPQGRQTAIAEILDNHVLEHVEAHGKHLFYDWRSAPILHVHLGLIGSFRQAPAPVEAADRMVQLRLAGPRAGFDLRAATTRELIDAERRQQIIDRLGPDPLDPEADAQRAWERLSKRSGPIAAALLDQQVIGGVGNVYRAEALFVTGIHPERPANSLDRDQFERLWQTLVSMLRQGVEDRRIITVHPSERSQTADGDIASVAPEDAFYVYKQHHCRRCGSPIHAWPIGPRRAYACERCQPMGDGC
jgi:endonuclease VIII